METEEAPTAANGRIRPGLRSEPSLERGGGGGGGGGLRSEPSLEGGGGATGWPWM